MTDKEEIKCNFTDEDIAKSFIEDVEAVKDLLPQESEDKMSLGTQEQRTEGMKKQAQELIDQAYQRGYKAAKEECAEAVEQLRENYLSDGITQGCNEAWEAARKIMSQNDASWGMKEMKEIFGSSYSTDIMHDLSASEAIEKLRAYEEQKQKEVEEIKVGDEVILNANSSYEPNTKAIVIMNDGGNSYPYNVIVADGDTEWVDRDTIDRKTGRCFPEIAEVLKKLQEDEE